MGNNKAFTALEHNMKRFFDIPDKDGEMLSVWIDLESNKASCTCVFGSFFCWGKKFFGRDCIHIRKAREILKNGHD